jgi:uncharacterized membrane protein YoaK (UPF0700 family)
MSQTDSNSAHTFALSTRWFVGVVVPIAVLLIGVAVKKLIHKQWRRDHFYLGIELSLVAFASTFTDMLTGPATDMAAQWLLLILLTLVYQATVHQSWEGESKKGWRQTGWLLFFSNASGIGLFLGYAYLVRK